ncbi:MAG: hypothetical protein K2K84_01670 [Muribaculaceae bacterium]|nr:hypothetical protein [Muribaculaceae bacterium]
MSEQEELNLYARIRENIRATQRKLYERKAKLGENVVVAGADGKPCVMPAAEALARFCTSDNTKAKTQK